MRPFLPQAEDCSFLVGEEVGYSDGLAANEGFGYCISVVAAFQEDNLGWVTE
ncbi:MAG: hypothetical protein ABR987_02635 [Terracidiphilus sp.]